MSLISLSFSGFRREWPRIKTVETKKGFRDKSEY